jgi:hypothetical protein
VPEVRVAERDRANDRALAIVQMDLRRLSFYVLARGTDYTQPEGTMTLSKNGKRIGRPPKVIFTLPTEKPFSYIQVQVGERFALLRPGQYYLVHNDTIYEKML